MGRIVKEYDQRHEELLNTAQALFYSKGYTQTSVQDIIDAVGIAKGTFYHYFDSKMALLEALIEQLISESLILFKALANDDSLEALPKLRQMFQLIANWKTERKDELLVVVQALFREENIILLHKMNERAISAVVPTLAQVIRQGVDEGVFDVVSPEDSAEIFFNVSHGFSDTFGRILLNLEACDEPILLLKRKKAAYEQAVERTLGAAPGSLPLFDEAIIEAWFE